MKIKMKIRRSLCFLPALCLLLFSACAPFRATALPSDTELTGEYLSPEELSGDLISVGFSQLGSESLWRRANTESVEQALREENGYFLLFHNARQKQENQIKAIRSFLSQNVDCIVFSPITEEGWTTVLEEAQKAEIPVILLDRSIDRRDAALYTCFVGEDMEQEGRNAGLWLERYLREKGMEEQEIRIAVLRGTQGSSAQRGRSMGFDRILEKHPNWHIVQQADGDFTTAKAKEAMQDILRSGVPFDVLLSQNDDMTFGALEALSEAGISTGEDGIAVISFDACRQALELVEQGVINVDIECNPESGELLASVISRIMRGEEVEKAYYMEDRVFTRDNVSACINDRKY